MGFHRDTQSQPTGSLLLAGPMQQHGQVASPAIWNVRSLHGHPLSCACMGASKCWIARRGECKCDCDCECYAFGKSLIICGAPFAVDRMPGSRTRDGSIGWSWWEGGLGKGMMKDAKKWFDENQVMVQVFSCAFRNSSCSFRMHTSCCAIVRMRKCPQRG